MAQRRIAELVSKEELERIALDPGDVSPPKRRLALAALPPDRRGTVMASRICRTLLRFYELRDLLDDEQHGTVYRFYVGEFDRAVKEGLPGLRKFFGFYLNYDQADGSGVYSGAPFDFFLSLAQLAGPIADKAIAATHRVPAAAHARGGSRSAESLPGGCPPLPQVVPRRVASSIVAPLA